MSTSIKEDKTFRNLSRQGKVTEPTEFVNCTFIDCDFSNSSFSSSKFIDCTFTNCNMSLAKLSNCQLNNALFKECKDLQAIRSKIIHQGNVCTEHDAEKARKVAVAVFEMIVLPMIGALNLQVVEQGEIKPAN